MQGSTLLGTWNDVLTKSFQDVWVGVIGFVPNLIVAILIFILGWVVASIIGRWVAYFIKSLQIDKAFQNLGAEELVARSGYHLNVGSFIGGLVKWFLIVIFLMASLEVLRLNEVNDFLRSVINYLPNVIVAALVLTVAAVIAEALQKVISGSAKALGTSSAHLFGGVAKWAIWIFAILVALNHLGVGGAFTQTLFGGVVTMLSIAGGLAFGLGGKDAAARYIEKLREDISGHR